VISSNEARFFEKSDKKRNLDQILENSNLSKSVKYEDVYLKAYSSITEARTELTKYFDRYNKKRRHQGLDNMTPDEVYWNTIPKLKEAV
jgi:putative transposase